MAFSYLRLSAGSLAKKKNERLAGSIFDMTIMTWQKLPAGSRLSPFEWAVSGRPFKRNHGGRGEQQPPERGWRRGGHGDRRAVVQGGRPQGRNAAAVGGEVPAQAVSHLFVLLLGVWRAGFAFFHWQGLRQLAGGGWRPALLLCMLSCFVVSIVVFGNRIASYRRHIAISLTSLTYNPKPHAQSRGPGGTRGHCVHPHQAH